MNTKSIEDILKNNNLLEKLAKKCFLIVDIDKSGELDLGELEFILTQLATSMGNEPPTKEEIKEILIDLDHNNSGKICYNEFKYLIRDVLAAMLDN